MYACILPNSWFGEFFQELLGKLIQHRHQLRERDSHIADLERYIDELLVKVIDLQPVLLNHDTPAAPPRPPTSPPGNAASRTVPTTHVASPFTRHAAMQRSRSERLKKFAIGLFN